MLSSVRVKEEQGEREELDLTCYTKDRVELMRQVFSILKERELRAMAPSALRHLPTDHLQEMCLDEVLGISSKRLCSILDGYPCPSETDSDGPDPHIETLSLDSISSGEDQLLSNGTKRKKKDKHAKKHRKRGGVEKGGGGGGGGEEKAGEGVGMTVLELLELQMRAKAIRAQLQTEQEETVSDGEDVEQFPSQLGPPDDEDDDEIQIKEEKPEVVEIITSSDEETPIKVEKCEETRKEKEGEVNKGGKVKLNRNRKTTQAKEKEKETEKIQLPSNDLRNLLKRKKIGSGESCSSGGSGRGEVVRRQYRERRDSEGSDKEVEGVGGKGNGKEKEGRREGDGSGSKGREVEKPGSKGRELEGSGSRRREAESSVSKERELEESSSRGKEVEISGSKGREVEGSGSRKREVERSGSREREVEGEKSKELSGGEVEGRKKKKKKGKGERKKDKRKECDEDEILLELSDTEKMFDSESSGDSGSESEGGVEKEVEREVEEKGDIVEDGEEKWAEKSVDGEGRVVEEIVTEEIRGEEGEGGGPEDKREENSAEKLRESVESEGEKEREIEDVHSDDVVQEEERDTSEEVIQESTGVRGGADMSEGECSDSSGDVEILEEEEKGVEGEVLELSDDSSRGSGICQLSKEPSREEILEMSFRLEEELAANGEGEEEGENTWKKRWLESDKVKSVLQTSSLLNAVRRKNMELRRRLRGATEGEKEEEGKEGKEGEGKVEGEEEGEKNEDKAGEEVDISSVEFYKTLPCGSKELAGGGEEEARRMVKDAKQLMKMYRRLLKMNKEDKGEGKRKKKKKKKDKKKREEP